MLSKSSVQWPADAANRIAAARASGASLGAIARDFRVSTTALRNKAISLGVYRVVPRRRFTADEDAIVQADYQAHVDIGVTAAKLGRSRGAVRQRIFHHMKHLIGQGRTPRSWRMLRRYGAAMLEHGSSPDDAARRLAVVIAEASADAKAAALAAKARRKRERIDQMLARIAAGDDRDAAILEARALGASLQDIGDAVGLTRERIRQICDERAFRDATRSLMVVPIDHDSIPDRP